MDEYPIKIALEFTEEFAGKLMSAIDAKELAGELPRTRAEGRADPIGSLLIAAAAKIEAAKEAIRTS